MKKKENEYSEQCEQCGEKSTTVKVRWDLEFPLVLCDSCHLGFKTNSSIQKIEIKREK